jgi:hypothetical protein
LLPISLNLFVLPCSFINEGYEQAPNGHMFACTRKSEQECFDWMLFATSRVYGENVLKIKRGDLLFLLNLDTNTLYGTFLAQSQGAKNIAPEVWKSRISIPSGGIAKWHSALIRRRKKTFSGMGISWHDMLDEDLAQSLSRYLENPDRRLKLIKKTAVYKPRLESTTLWDYPPANLWQDSKVDIVCVVRRSQTSNTEI